MNWKKILLLSIPPIVWLIALLAFLQVFIHENFHCIYCIMCGGACTMVFNPQVYPFFQGKPIAAATFCQGFPTEMGPTLSLIAFIGELSTALVLFAIPFTSLLGGIYLFVISKSLYLGMYEHDLSVIPPDHPLYFLNEPSFRIIFMVVSTIILIVSVIIYFLFWRRILKK